MSESVARCADDDADSDDDLQTRQFGPDGFVIAFERTENGVLVSPAREQGYTVREVNEADLEPVSDEEWTDYSTGTLEGYR